MNITERLERAIAKLDAMSEDDFRNDLIRFGYEPKLDTINFLTISHSLEHSLAYVTKCSITSNNCDTFSQNPANDYEYGLAA